MFPARTADRIVMLITSVGLGCSALWLRQKVAGRDGLSVIAVLALLVSVNKLWFLGLYPFLLGACLFPVTLGLWWKWREEMKAWRAAVLAALLVAGYFLHIVSVGLTAVGLVTLAAATPGTNLRKRWLWSGLSLIPLSCLAAWFGLLMRSSSREGAEWIGLNDAWSLSSWFEYLQAPDLLSISFKSSFLGILSLSTDCPFVDAPSTQFAVLTPALWATIGVIAMIVSSLRGNFSKSAFLSSQHRGWIVLTAFLLAFGLFGPSNTGQGAILRERVLLLGLIALASSLRFDAGKPPARIGAIFLTLALILQIAFTWDYALRSNRLAGEVVRCGDHIENGQRVAMVLIDTRTHYAVTPFVNIVNQLGVGSERIIWNNYGPNYYYMPVSFSNKEAQDCLTGINSLNESFISGRAEEAASMNPQKWAETFDHVFNRTDVLIMWGSSSWFDSISARWFERDPVFEQEQVRLFRRK
jgi:hypothetical protein